MKPLKSQFIGHEAAILEQFGIDATFRKNKPCPACEGTDRFTLFQDYTHYCRQCGSGDFLDLICKAKRIQIKVLLKMIGGGQNQSYMSYKPPKTISSENKKERTRARLKQIMDATEQVTPGSNVHRYLVETRGFPISLIPTELRQHPDLPYYEEVSPGNWEVIGEYPAMIAPIKNKLGKIQAVHATFLLDGKKAPVANPKKLIGLAKGGIIQLYPAKDEIGIAEGIETAMAASDLFGVPVWAAMSATLMPLVELPETIKTVFVFSDNDANLAGQRGALKLIEKLEAQKKVVGACKTPTTCDTDFYDVWRKTNAVKQLTV